MQFIPRKSTEMVGQQGRQTAVGTRITVLETSRSSLKPPGSAGSAPRLLWRGSAKIVSSHSKHNIPCSWCLDVSKSSSILRQVISISSCAGILIDVLQNSGICCSLGNNKRSHERRCNFSRVGAALLSQVCVLLTSTKPNSPSTTPQEIPLAMVHFP